jgi:GntR family histidine utilization transcriptional repressor
VTPLYQKIKDYIRAHIRSGEWQFNERIPSENELVDLMGASRMTVNRALRELTDEGLLVRTAGVGTFVAKTTPHTHPLEVRNIADEIRERGHQHKAQVITQERVRAAGELARNFGVMPRTELFHSIIVHYENDQPIQVEDRYVNPKIAPGYETADFTRMTPYEYLVAVAPLQEAEHILQAVMPSPSIKNLLVLGENEPCLLLQRRTWTNGVVASTARLYYPGSRYEMTGRFKP